MNQPVRFFWFLIIAIFTQGYSNAQMAVPKEYPTTTRINYVRSWNAVKPDNNTNNFSTSSGLQHSFMSTSYFDGLGRPLQTVIKKGSLETDPGNPTSSTGSTDVVNTVIYDEMGRQAYKYLPFVANNTAGNPSLNDGVFKLNAFQQQAAFMQQQYGTQGETYFYGKTNFDGSPLNRPEKVMEPGNSWVGGSRGTELKFWINTANDAVRIWTVTDNPGSFGSYNTTATYAAGELFKNIKVDEHGKQVIEFKDKEGQVILKKIQLTASADNGTGSGHVDWLCTYYIYDELNNLRCVIQPEGVKAIQSTWALTTTLLNEQCFRYEYDQRGRMYIKKTPGAGEVYMIHDSKDRLVMTQDAIQRSMYPQQWLITKYDNFNRPVETGLWQDNTPFLTHLSGAIGSSSYPVTSTGYEELSKTFYEGYTWLALYGNPLPSIYNNSYDGFFQTVSNINWPYAQANTQTTKLKGLATGSRLKILGSSSYLYTVSFYDNKGKVIQTQSTNITGGIDINTTQYSWTEQPLVFVQRQQKGGVNPQEHIVITKTEYDDLGRVLAIKKSINSTIGGVGVSKPELEIVRNFYDKSGRLKSKRIGKKKDSNGNYTSDAMETLSYDYNIRGWLLGMNRDYLTDAGSNNYFGFELGYDKLTNKANRSFLAGSNAGEFNGNINGVIWKSQGDQIRRKYDFEYDAASRLLKGDFEQNDNSSAWGSSAINYSMKMGNGVDPWSAYDANGNIKAMTQFGWKLGGSATTPLDNLTYTYIENSNKLKNVIDAQNDPLTKLGDFRTSQLYMTALGGVKQNTAIDYVYDENGNLKRDRNKDIGDGGNDGIVYNHLNLPQTVTVRTTSGAVKGTITYTYDAGGIRLKKEVAESGQPTKTTLYVGGMIYENDELQFIAHEEGRVRYQPANSSGNKSFEFDYMIRDHLGNVRMVLTDEQKTDDYFASMEVARRTIEEALFTNIGNTESDLPDGYPADTYTDPNLKVAKVRGDGQKVGPGVMLKVMAGDKFNLRVNSWYKLNGSTPQAPTGFINDLLFMLSYGVQQATGGHTTQSGLQNSGILTPGANDFLSTQSDYLTGRPKAFVNWVLFDEQFKFVASNSNAEQVGADQEFTTHVRYDEAISKNGYLYIYVSNETPNISVFFDNLQVTHIRGPIMEETHYYPFGLTMSGISSRALGFGKENKFRFNDGTELSSKEFIDGSGLELYETPFRGYDPQIGRFWQIDAMSDSYENWSPYVFGLDNPMIFNDPSGLASVKPGETSTEEKPKELIGITLKSSYKNKWNYIHWTLFVDKNKHHDYRDLYNYLENKGVDNQGLKFFAQAWKGIPYRQKLAEIEHAWRSFVKEALLEGATWVGGGVVLKIGGKLIKVSYQSYKLYRLRQAEKGAKYLYHYTSEAAAKSISEGGLKVGKDGFSYLTNNGNLSPLQAQIELGLPANRALPTSIIKINVTGLDPALVRRVTGNLPGMSAGGGTEYLFNQHIPSNLIQIIK